MTDHNTTGSNRSRKRKAAPDVEVLETKSLSEFEVLEVEATPIVEPAPMPTPIPEPEPAPEPVAVPKVKPWELIRPMQQEDPNAWHRGQKWRP